MEICMRDNLLPTICLIDSAFELLSNFDKFIYILSVKSPYLT